jgi:hypothetical protein
MHVCAASITDPEGNRCNWTQCGLATTANQYIGGCVGNATAGTLCAPDGCADGSVEQLFAGKMVGCAGKSAFADRLSLCAPGYRVATTAEWTEQQGGIAPAHDFWTDDVLAYSGSASDCSVGFAGSEGFAGTACPDGSPMRICAASQSDPEGNQCNWTGCQLGDSSRAFGGCVGNTTAGTLCVPAIQSPTVCDQPDSVDKNGAIYGTRLAGWITGATSSGECPSILTPDGTYTATPGADWLAKAN